MRLKFYLIGLGIGIIVTAVVMGIALRGRTREMSDDEIMARARQLGMVEASTLTELSDSANNGQGTQLLSNNGQAQTAAEQTTQNQTGALVAGDSATGESIESANAASSASNDAPGEGDETRSENGRTGGEGGPLVVTGEPDDDEADAEAGDGADTDGADTPSERAEAGSTAAASETAGQSDTENGTGAAAAGSGGSGTGSSQARTDQPVTGSIVVTIPDGVGSEEICELLQSAGVIDSAAAFNNFLVQSDRDRFIGTGARLIPRGATYEEVGFIISGR